MKYLLINTTLYAGEIHNDGSSFSMLMMTANITMIAVEINAREVRFGRL